MANGRCTDPRFSWWCEGCCRDLSSDSFGFYLSGLFDGEGHFQLCNSRCRTHLTRRAEFNIGMRRDDVAMLKAILAYFGCGHIYDKGKVYNTEYNRAPMARYYVSRPEDLINTMIPFFERYPLRAKKARDYAIWKEGVRLVFDVSQRNGQVKWRPEDIERFDLLIANLQDCRKYRAT